LPDFTDERAITISDYTIIRHMDAQSKEPAGIVRQMLDSTLHQREQSLLVRCWRKIRLQDSTARSGGSLHVPPHATQPTISREGGGAIPEAKGKTQRQQE